jgi:hypothetical protein
MMQAANLRNGEDSAALGRFHLALNGRVAIQRQMSPRKMIVVQVRSEDSSEVSLVEHDDMFEALSTDTADQAFNVRILPWGSWRRDDFSDAHVADALAEVHAVDAVAVSAVGCAVTLKWATMRRWCRSTTKQNSMRSVAVGTVKKSMATMSRI